MGGKWTFGIDELEDCMIDCGITILTRSPGFPWQTDQISTD